jgi:hypothetical protein
MLLSHVSPERLEFSRYRRTRAPVLVGVAFAALALLPLLSPGPVTAWRVITSAVVLLSAILLIRFTRPRWTHVVLRVRDRVLERDGLEIPLGDCAVQLVGARDEAPPYPGATYRAELVLPDADGRRELLLERDEPAGVLSDLIRIRAVLPLPVRGGWGLPADAAPWDTPKQEQSPPRRGGAPIDALVRRHPAQRSSAVTTLIGGIGTATAMGIMIGAQRERGLPVSALSLTLAGATVVLIVLIGAFIASDRLRIQGDDELCIERRALGIAWKRQTIQRSALRHAWTVGPDPAEPHHLLLQLDSGLLALPCVGDQARKLQSQLDA